MQKSNLTQYKQKRTRRRRARWLLPRGCARLLDDGVGDREARAGRPIPDIVAGRDIGPDRIREEDADRAADGDLRGRGEVELQDLRRPGIEVDRRHVAADAVHRTSAIHQSVVPDVDEVVHLLRQVVRRVGEAVREVAEVHGEMTHRHLVHPALVVETVVIVVHLEQHKPEIDVAARRGRRRELVARGVALVDLEHRVADVREDRARLRLDVRIGVVTTPDETALAGIHRFVARVFLGRLDDARGISGRRVHVLAVDLRLRAVSLGRGGGHGGIALLLGEVVVGAGDEEQDGGGEEGTHGDSGNEPKG